LPLVRKIHAYLGLLIAPSVLFFALSGILQLFSLHEAHGPYHPPALFETLGHLHKDQVLSRPAKEHGPPKASDPTARAKSPAAHDHEASDTPKIRTYVLKWFFALVGLGLFVSTILGVWMGLRFTRSPGLSWGLLIAGALAPALILAL